MAPEHASSPPAAVIFGLDGETLTTGERQFFSEIRPFGYILFARNISAPAQVRSLVQDLRSLDPSHDPFILIDQEGGGVQRLRPPHWRFAPAGGEFAALYRQNPETARRALRLNMALIGRELADLGIDVDCAPVLDVPVPGAHDIIGDRAFGDTADMVADLGRAAADGLIDAGVVPVIKHIPGHGRAKADSHLDLPIVDTEEAELFANDFKAFCEFLKPQDCPPVFAMTAHVIYSAIDPNAPATWSAKIVQDVIRGRIGFQGLLMSDDLSMKALTGPFDERAQRCFEAGCDIVLHCNGDPAEMSSVAKATVPLGERGLQAIGGMAALRRKPRGTIENVAAAEAQVVNWLRHG
ncbi:MAG: beta-N-acetylhexosaminidase [Rhodobacteraceae bacterium]|nr:beta-N-acetylhexosaminidase [Paracoccaceae bacterium]